MDSWILRIVGRVGSNVDPREIYLIYIIGGGFTIAAVRLEEARENMGKQISRYRADIQPLSPRFLAARSPTVQGPSAPLSRNPVSGALESTLPGPREGSSIRS